MLKNIFKISLIFLLFIGCNSEKESKKESSNTDTKATISKNAEEIRDYMIKNMVIAHRGSTYWTPEETEPAFRWARNIGADYLEFDVQLTKDSVLVAFHDKNLNRTTNIATLFPDRINSEINDFTLTELRSLDAGSWFNKENPDRARGSYKNLKILTLKDIVMIAEGYKIKTENGKPKKENINGQWTGKYLYEKDPKDVGNRPGLYIETKNPKPNIEKILTRELTKYGWNINKDKKKIETYTDKIAIGNSEARVILQSFSEESIITLDSELPNTPKCLLLWHPYMKDDIKGNYIKAIDFGIKYNIQSIGSSIAGEPNNYEELTAPWMAELIHNAGMVIHPYTFDTIEQLEKYKDRVEGVFTNRADLALEFFGRKNEETAQEILINLEY